MLVALHVLLINHITISLCADRVSNSLPIDYLKYMKNQCLVLVAMYPNNYTHELCPATLLKRLLCASQASQKIFEKPVCFRAFMVSLGFEPVPLPRMPLVHCLSLFCVSRALSCAEGGWRAAVSGLASPLPALLHYGPHPLLPPLLPCNALQ